jgi:hypothetical protein
MDAARLATLRFKEAPMFGRKPKLPRKVRKIFEKVAEFAASENLQNQQLPPLMQAEILSGENADILAGGDVQTFGKLPTNPIPVNGPIGEVLYLSSLSTPSGKIVLFHRLGSKNTIDVFEVVGLDGQHWDIFYFSMYHPRRSRMAPVDFKPGEVTPFVSGINALAENFPMGLRKAVMECSKRMFGIPTPNPELTTIEKRQFSRPTDHVQRLKEVFSSVGFTKATGS